MKQSCTVRHIAYLVLSCSEQIWVVDRARDRAAALIMAPLLCSHWLWEGTLSRFQQTHTDVRSMMGKGDRGWFYVDLIVNLLWWSLYWIVSGYRTLYCKQILLRRTEMCNRTYIFYQVDSTFIWELYEYLPNSVKDDQSDRPSLVSRFDDRYSK